MQKYIIFIVVAVLIVIGAMMYKPSAPEGAAGTMEQGSINEPAPGTVGRDTNVITNPMGLIIEDVKVGTGDEAKPGALITVHYVGTLDNGTKFDSSRDRGEPFQFPLGQGMVIAGWEQGFNGMKIGGVRKLTIPPELGYGAQGAGGVIPPNATLHFEVELLAVRYK